MQRANNSLRCWRNEWEIVISSRDIDSKLLLSEAIVFDAFHSLSCNQLINDPIEWSFAVKFCTYCVSAYKSTIFSHAQGEELVLFAMKELCCILRTFGSLHDDRCQLLQNLICELCHLETFWVQPQYLSDLVCWTVLHATESETSTNVITELRHLQLQPYLGNGVRVGVIQNIESCLENLFLQINVERSKHIAILSEILLSLFCIHVIHPKEYVPIKRLYAAAGECLVRLGQYCELIQESEVLAKVQKECIACVPLLYMMSNELNPHATRIMRYLFSPSSMRNNIYTDSDIFRGVDSDNLMLLLHECRSAVFLLSDRLIHISLQLRCNSRFADVLHLLSKLLSQIRIHLVDVTDPTDASFSLIQSWPETSSRLLHIYEGHIAEARIMRDVDALTTFVTALYDGVLQISLCDNEDVHEDCDVQSDVMKNVDAERSSNMHDVEQHQLNNVGTSSKEVFVIQDSDSDDATVVEDTAATPASIPSATQSTGLALSSVCIPVAASQSLSSHDESSTSDTMKMNYSSSLIQNGSGFDSSYATIATRELQLSRRSIHGEEERVAKRPKHEESIAEPIEPVGKIMKITGGANWLQKKMQEKKVQQEQKNALSKAAENKQVRQSHAKKPAPGLSLRQRLFNEKHSSLLREECDEDGRDSNFAYEDFRSGRGATRAVEYGEDSDALDIYGHVGAADLDDDLPPVAPPKPALPRPRPVNLHKLMTDEVHGSTNSVAKASKTHTGHIDCDYNVPVDVNGVRLRFCEFILRRMHALTSGNGTRSVEETVELQTAKQRFQSTQAYKERFLPLILEEVKSMLSDSIVDRQQTIRHRGNQFNARQYSKQSRLSRESASSAQTAVFDALLPFPEKAISDSLVSVRVKGSSSFEKDDLILVSPVDITTRSVCLGDLLVKQHYFAIVSRSSRADVNASERCLIMPLMHLPEPTIKWSCVHLTSLSTHLREYTAVHCIESLRSMPLAPYILSASPVCSGELLNNVITSIERCTLQLQEAGRSSSNKAILSNLLAKLDFLHLLKVDFSVLGATNAPKRLKKVVKCLNVEKVNETITVLIAEWKEKTKVNHKESTLSSMIGGNIAVIPDEMPCPEHLHPVVWGQFIKRFNASQLYAIEYVSKPLQSVQDTRIALVQGPPGCGKTWCIIGMISAILQASNVANLDGKRLLVCAASNAAVDEVLARLRNGIPTHSGSNMELRMVRIGKPVEGTDNSFVEGITLDAQTDREVERHSLTKDLRLVNDDILKLTSQLTRFSEADRWSQAAEPIRKKLQRLRHAKQRYEDDLNRFRVEARAAILSSAHIIGCTLSGAAHPHLQEYVDEKNVIFDAVLIDEAAQATEPACLIPLRYGAKTLVLVGDPRQLPAYVNSPKAQDLKLGMSLFERLEKANHEVVMLQVQYRMHPDIRQFPSAQFYANRLKDADDILQEVEHWSGSTELVKPKATRVICDVVRKGVVGYLSPVTFFNLQSDEASCGTSYRNATEARFIASLIFYYKECFQDYSVGIITAYRSQLTELKSHKVLSDNNAEINTIDGFQGREKDIIIVSTVRSNPRGGIGFLADERRLNVALTRAKRCLIVVGNASVLEGNTLWRSMLHNTKTEIVTAPSSGNFTELSMIREYDKIRQKVLQRRNA